MGCFDSPGRQNEEEGHETDLFSFVRKLKIVY
jgi:hypothetical protein